MAVPDAGSSRAINTAITAIIEMTTNSSIRVNARIHFVMRCPAIGAVSYTHLTLPTILLV